MHTRILPAATAHLLLQAVARADSDLMPPETLRLLAAAMTPARLQAYRPIIGRDCFYPNEILPEVADGPRWVRDYSAQVATADTGNLLEQVLEEYHGTTPPHWRPVFARPRAWLEALARAIEAADPVLSALWATTRARMEVEIGRIEQIVHVAGAGVLLNHLSARMTFSGGELQIAHGRDVDYPTTGSLTLVPLVAGPMSFLLHGPPDDTQLAYAMPGAISAIQGSPRPAVADDRIGAVFGTARARVLRALVRPSTVTELAGTLDSAVSTISYHCHGLQAAGLIDAVRVGRSVWMVRTALGTELIELLSGR